MNKIVSAHGGILKPLLLKRRELPKAIKMAENLVKVNMSSKECSDFIMLAIGAFSPLDGFMTKDDYDSVVNKMELKNGLLWPIPITLAVSMKKAKEIQKDQEVALVNKQSGEIVGLMIAREKYLYDKKTEAINIFKTEENAHPGVKSLYNQEKVYIGGPIRAFGLDQCKKQYSDFALPAETRAIFKERGWSKITAFQTRNPIHRSHEYLLKIAMEVSDGIFIHPIVGKLKDGDIPDQVRVECYKTIIDKYFLKKRVVFRVYPMEMRYAGPKEAILHAIIRQNFGCSHIIIGRDHAGVGEYYGSFEAQNIFNSLKPGALEIKPLKLDWTFWCYECNGMASLKTCQHAPQNRCLISGTKLRTMLKEGQDVPDEFSRPEILKILKSYYTSGLERM